MANNDILWPGEGRLTPLDEYDPVSRAKLIRHFPHHIRNGCIWWPPPGVWLSADGSPPPFDLRVVDEETDNG